MRQAERKEGAEAPPSAATRTRESVTRTVKRTASGNIQMSTGRIVTPKDKADLSKLD